MIRLQRVLLAVMVLVLAACSPKIYGTVQLVDKQMQPIAVEKENPQGTVVNMINTTASLEQASHSVVVNAEGKFKSEKKKIVPGTYKVETSRIGYITVTETVEIGKFTGKKIEFKLKKIREGTRRTIGGAGSDKDKIINPGEVNIRPPTM